MKRDHVQALREQFADAISVAEFRGEITIIVLEPDRLVEICRFLKDSPGLEYSQLAGGAGIDYADNNGVLADPRRGRFAMNYHLLSMRWNQRLRVKVYWDDGEAPIPSVCELWPNANWEEREAYDMFGIEFANHPDLRRLLMPVDWQGYPQRKDYPLGYETVQFSFNFDEIQRHKPYAKE